MLCIGLTFFLIITVVQPLNQVASTPQWTDWRDTGTISPVIDQGVCNAGWAIAATSLYEWQIAVEGQGSLDLSDGYTLDCSGQGGCGNGSLLGALKYLLANGTPLQSNFGNNDIYNGQQSTNSSICSSFTNIKVNRTVVLNTFLKVSSSKLKKLIAKAPTANEIYADNDFNYYYGSASPYKCKRSVKKDIELNHAVMVVGYDKNGHFYLKNSKGTNWGINGYMLIKKNHDCGLRRRVHQYGTTIQSSAYSTLGSIRIASIAILVSVSLLMVL